MADDTDQTAPALPTEKQLAAARGTLAKVAMATAEPAKAAMIELVTSKAFTEAEKLAHAAQDLNRGDNELSYMIGMMARLRASHEPK